MQSGIPSFDVASCAHAELIREGKHNEARALEHILTNKVWCGARLLDGGIVQDPEEAICKRCDLGATDTELRRYYKCLANAHIDHPNVTKTQYLCRRAIDEGIDAPCLSFRAIVPRHYLAPLVGWIDENNCRPTFHGPFDKVLRNTCTAGTDGGRDSDKQMTTTRVSVGVAIYDERHDKFACMSAPVLGLQTSFASESGQVVPFLLAQSTSWKGL